jgi:hypothetical protein
MSGWNPPNVGYQCDPVSGLPIPTQFDPSLMPEGVPPTIRIIGSHAPQVGCSFAAVDNLTGGQGGYVFPPSSES